MSTHRNGSSVGVTVFVSDGGGWLSSVTVSVLSWRLSLVLDGNLRSGEVASLMYHLRIGYAYGMVSILDRKSVHKSMINNILVD